MTAARFESHQANSLPNFLDDRSMTLATPIVGQTNVTNQTRPTDGFGVALAEMTCAAETGLAGTPTDHVIGLLHCAPAPTKHTMAGKRLQHLSKTGSICVCPAGADYAVEYGAPVHGIVLQISRECLALACAELGHHGAVLVERMDSQNDELSKIAKAMAVEARRGHRGGALLWSSMTDALVRRLAAHHSSHAVLPIRGGFGTAALRRLDRFIQDKLHGSIDLAQLAGVVGCDQYHFAHRFRSTVGISPYRYVVRCRLERARTLLRQGRRPIAEIAVASGFTDQSHLTNWMRRIYGTTPAQLTAVT